MKKIHEYKKWIQKSVERIPLASFVSAVKKIAGGVKEGLNAREVRLAFLLTILMIGVLAFSFVLFLDNGAQKGEQIDEPQEEEVVKIYHPFTGEEQDTPQEEPLFIFGIMVENAFDAWPLSGVEDAFLVIEAPVEGSIPRFITFFAEDQEVDEIGPVRSARPYFVDWVDSFDAVYAHVGGSPEALEQITADNTQDINEFFNAKTFWRSAARLAPHNVYTSIERLERKSEEEDFEKQIDGWFAFEAAEEIPEDEQVKKITINWFETPSRYDVHWDFNEGHYTRTQGDRPTGSADWDDYAFENVIIMETDIRSIDAVDRKRLRTVGEGEALLFKNGQHQEVTWKRSASGKVRFENIWNEEVVLTPGQTWISVIPSLEQVEWE